MGSALPPGEPDSGPDASRTPEHRPAEASAEDHKPAAGAQATGSPDLDSPDSELPAAQPPEPAEAIVEVAPPLTPARPGGKARRKTRTRAERIARRRRRVRRILIWGSASLALLLVLVVGAGYLLLRHFNANIQQDDITGLLGRQPVKLHPQAENILVIGSDTRNGQGKGYGTGFVTDQSDTLMIVHIPADRQWAEVMSIPRDSWVRIPSCVMGDGQKSAPTQFKINEAFAIGNLDGNHTALGVACTVRTVEQNTGIYIDHFVVVSFEGFKDMVAALGGVEECNPTAINDPLSHLHLSPGYHMLTPAQALGYVRARYTLGDGSDLQRIGRQQAFMSSLISRVKSELFNPLAIYRFLDAATRSLTIDSQLGGITGLYDLGQSLRDLPPDKIAFFTLPNFPRGEVVPGDTANVLWTQPEDNEIFASFRDDVPASPSLFGSRPAHTGSVAAGLSAGTAQQVAGHAASTPAASSGAPSSAGPSPGASQRAAPLTIQARTANQNICAG
jgi:LCP family protein required for cell wall assembly